MIILGIESATAEIGCALGGNEGPLASFHARKGRHHAETLAPAIEFVCGQAGIGLDEVNAVAVDIGPGLFTGLRVGVATGKALASALRVPMIGLVSLDLLAFPHRRCGRLIASVVDARRSEVFWALYRPVPAGVQRVTDYRVSLPGEVASELLARADETLVVGDGGLRYAGDFRSVSHVEVAGCAEAYPSADVLLELAHPLALREEFVQPGDLKPMYLRTADVRINWSERSGSQSPTSSISMDAG